MLRTIPVLAALATLVAAPAHSSEQFAGPRVEVRAGYDRLGFEVVIFETGVGETSLGRFHYSGISYGIGAGYDIAITRKIVGGVEVDADFSTAGLSQSSSFQFNSETLTSRSTTKQQRDISAVARLGIRAGRRLLVYVGGGYSSIRSSSEATVRPASPTFPDRMSDAHADGWRAVGGMEFVLANGTYAKVEHRHSDYGYGYKRDQLLVGGGWRF